MIEATPPVPAPAIGAAPVAAPRHRPIRTCVGCRATAPQAELLRIAVVDDALVADLRRRAGGRGVYVHRRPDCLRAAGRGGLARALKRNVSRAALDAIAGAAAASATVGPDTHAGIAAATPGEAAAVAVANDASQGGADAVERAPHLTSPASTSPVDPADRASHGA